MKKKIEIKDIIIFIIPFVVFGLYLYVFFPGILTFDSYNQLQQIKAGEFFNWHPFIHTFFEMICMKIYKSPASVGIAQIIIFSFIWCIICKYNRKSNDIIEFLLQIFVTVIIVLNPINCMHSITLWKDVLFSYGILLTCFLLQVAIDKKFCVNNKYIIFYAFLLSFVSKVRLNGIFCTIAIITILSIMFYKNNKKDKMYIKLPALFICFMFAIFVLERIYNVQDNAKSAVITKTMHAIGFYETKGYLNKKDKEIISKVIDINDLIDNYNDYYADNIYVNTKIQEAKKNKIELIKIVLKTSVKHPISCFSFLGKSSTMVWSVVKPKDMVGTILWLDINSSNNDDNIKPLNLGKPFYKLLHDYLENSKNSNVAYSLLYSPATFLYLVLICCIIINATNKMQKVFLISMPIFVNSFIVALSTPIQDIRYLYSNMLIFYLLLIILINTYTIGGKEGNEKNK